MPVAFLLRPNDLPRALWELQTRYGGDECQLAFNARFVPERTLQRLGISAFFNLEVEIPLLDDDRAPTKFRDVLALARIQYHDYRSWLPAEATASARRMTVHSSSGDVTIDGGGVPVDYRLEDEYDSETILPRIRAFDLGEYYATYGRDGSTSFDILDLGYWYVSQVGGLMYEPPDHDFRHLQVAEFLGRPRREAAPPIQPQPRQDARQIVLADDA